MTCRCFQVCFFCVVIGISLSADDVSKQTLTVTSFPVLNTTSTTSKMREKRVETNITADSKNSNVTPTDGITEPYSSNISNLSTSMSKDFTESEENSTGVMFDSPTWLSNIKSGALERTGFVALAVMSVLLLFFVIRAIRVRHKRSKTRKYGIITSTASEMEMEPLEGRGDDDEEETLFDAQQTYLIK